MAIKIVCDRCDKIIAERTYYTIDIHAADLGATYGVTLSAAITNMETNLRNAFGESPCYCKQCVESIEDFIRNGKER